jgi:hypothetical protein
MTSCLGLRAVLVLVRLGAVVALVVPLAPRCAAQSHLPRFERTDTRAAACHAGIVAQFLKDPTQKPDTSCVATIPPILFATAWEPAKGP